MAHIKTMVKLAVFQLISPWISAAQKMKIFIKDFVSKCNQIHSKHLLKIFVRWKIFCTVSEIYLTLQRHIDTPVKQLRSNFTCINSYRAENQG